jgi:hypothetical protein
MDEETGTPNGQGNTPDLTELFKAPDLAAFIKKPRSAVAKEYEDRTKAFLKAGLIGAINAGNLPDAATLIEHGPGFASAAGYLADADERARKVIDFISAPANPYAMFLMTALPLVSQLVRNHERELAAAPQAFRTRKERREARKTERAAQPKAQIHLPFGKTLTIGLKARFPVGKVFAAFRTQTTSPEDITVKVFSNPAVVRELRKQGVVFQQATSGDG